MYMKQGISTFILYIHNNTRIKILIQYNTIQYNTIQYNTIQYNTILYNTIQYYTTQYNTIQYNTIQYNTIQYNTILYNTILYNTIIYNIPYSINCRSLQTNFSIGSSNNIEEFVFRKIFMSQANKKN